MIKTMPNAGRTHKSVHPLKVTALLYLKGTLVREQYEKCAEIVALAKEFGATELEVTYLLEDPRRNPT